jgi:hypothetical protein
MRFRTYSYRFAEQVLNSKLELKKEIEEIIGSVKVKLEGFSRSELNRILEAKFTDHKWESQPTVFHEPKDPTARIDFLKERIGIEVGFGHSSFIGIDLLKFQTLSYSNLDKIDVGVYIVVTNGFRKRLCSGYQQKWEGSLTFEKVCKYLPHFRSAIQVPIFVYGIEE